MQTNQARQASAQGGTAGSQTLARGLRALDLLAEADSPLSIAELAQRLGVHRSNAYRLLRTLEEQRYVVRDAAGLIRLGPRIAALARGVSPALQAAARAELSRLADALGMTAFVTLLDAAEVVTLVSAEPSRAHPTVAQRPGARHPLAQGAPGHAIEAVLPESEHRRLLAGAPLSDAAAEARARGYAVSHDEVVPGLTSVAVPLEIAGEPPAALAIVTIGLPGELERLVRQLHDAAARIANSYR